MRIQTNSNNVQKAVATERDRVALRDILRAKGKTVADNTPLSTLIQLVNSIGINSTFNSFLKGTENYTLVDTEKIITKLKNSVFKSGITEAKLPVVTDLGYDVFRDNSVITKIEIATDTETTCAVDNWCFGNCSSLKSFEGGNINFSGDSQFSSDPNLEKVVVKKLFSTPSSLFSGDSSLKIVDFGVTPTFQNNNLFYNCSNIKAVVIRTSSIATLNGTNTFSWIVNNVAGWYIYIPYALHTSSGYAAANNWSSVASTYATNNSGADVFKSIQENLVDLLSYGMDITDYYEIVESLPTSNIDDTIVYLIETATAGTYEQHFHGSGSWEQLANISLLAS